MAANGTAQLPGTSTPVEPGFERTTSAHAAALAALREADAHARRN